VTGETRNSTRGRLRSVAKGRAAEPATPAAASVPPSAPADPVGAAAGRAEAAMAESGLLPGDPLYPLVSALCALVRAAGTAVHGARGLTPDGESELIGRVTAAVAAAVADEARRVVWRQDLRTALLGAAVLLVLVTAAGAGGCLWDYRRGAAAVAVTGRDLAAMFAAGPATAQAVADLARANDLGAALRGCTGAAVRKEQGKTICTLPLWIDGVRIP